MSFQETAQTLKQDLSSEKVDTMSEQFEKWLIHYEKENIAIPELHTEVTSTKEEHKKVDISQRMYQCLYNNVLYHITLGLQYTPPSVEDISSVNTKVSKLLPDESNTDI